MLWKPFGTAAQRNRPPAVDTAADCTSDISETEPLQLSCSPHCSSFPQNIQSCWSCCSPPAGSKHTKNKPHMFKLQRNNSVFLCLYIRIMCGRGLCFWPSYPAVIYILLLGQHPTMPCFLCIIESPSGILKRGRGLAIKGSRAAYSTRVTSKTL